MEYWKSRNTIVFQNALPNLLCSFVRAKRSSIEWKRWHQSSLLAPTFHPSHSSPTIATTRIIEWTSPPEGVVKINFDRSFSLA